MQAPADLYFTYLFARGWSVDRVEQEAISLRLDYLNQRHLIELQAGLNLPESFRPQDKKHAASRAWLESHGLGELFPHPWPGAVASAYQMLQRSKCREVLEVMALVHSTPEEIVGVLRKKKIQASEEAVSWALRLFWSVQDMDAVDTRTAVMLRRPSAAELGNPDTAEVAGARKRASYSDPRALVMGLPASPLASAFAQTALGLPMRKLDMRGTLEMVQHLLLRRLVECSNATDQEFTLRVHSLVSSIKMLSEMQEKLSSPTGDVGQTLQAALLKFTTSGAARRDLKDMDMLLNPYLNRVHAEEHQGPGGRLPPASDADRGAEPVLAGEDGDAGG